MSSPTLVRFGSFSPSLPHLIAMREGYYKERGLHVEQHRIPSSPAMREALRANDLDVVLTSPDNIANYRLNGSARAHLDARIIAGVDGAGSVSLMGRPGLRDLGDIRGGRVAVDARGSGFAFLLYELLQQRGLSPGTHYSVVEMGGTPSAFRWAHPRHLRCHHPQRRFRRSRGNLRMSPPSPDGGHNPGLSSDGPRGTGKVDRRRPGHGLAISLRVLPGDQPPPRSRPSRAVHRADRGLLAGAWACRRSHPRGRDGLTGRTRGSRSRRTCAAGSNS